MDAISEAEVAFANSELSSCCNPTSVCILDSAAEDTSPSLVSSEEKEIVISSQG